MLRKRLFGMMTLVIGIMLNFSLIACNKNSGNNKALVGNPSERLTSMADDTNTTNNNSGGSSVEIGGFALNDIPSEYNTQGLLPYEDEWNARTYGYIDRTGKIVIPAQFELVYGKAEPFYEGMRQAYTAGQKQTTFFKADSTKVTYNFESMSNFSSGIAIGFSNNKAFFIKINGDNNPINFTYIYSDVAGHIFNEGIALVLENNRVIAINTSFNKLFELPVEFSSTSHKFSSGLLAIKNARGLWGYMDRTGKMVISAKFALLSSYFGNGRYDNDRENENANFQGNYAILSNEYNEFYVINKQGDIIKTFETADFDFPLAQMFIHGDYLVYTPNNKGNIKIINLLTEKEIDVDLASGSEYYIINTWPKALGENIIYYGNIISNDGRILFKIPNYRNSDSDMNLEVWYDKYIVIHNEGYFTIYDETGREISVKQ